MVDLAGRPQHGDPALDAGDEGAGGALGVDPGPDLPVRLTADALASLLPPALEATWDHLGRPIRPGDAGGELAPGAPCAIVRH